MLYRWFILLLSPFGEMVSRRNIHRFSWVSRIHVVLDKFLFQSCLLEWIYRRVQIDRNVVRLGEIYMIQIFNSISKSVYYSEFDFFTGEGHLLNPAKSTYENTRGFSSQLASPIAYVTSKIPAFDVDVKPMHFRIVSLSCCRPTYFVAQSAEVVEYTDYISEEE